MASTWVTMAFAAPLSATDARSCTWSICSGLVLARVLSRPDVIL